MSDPPDPDEIRARLLELRAKLERTAAVSSEAARPVELDQARVGRLSRMDALQAQALARETEQRRLVDLRRIASALKRLDEDEYGYCVRCGEPVAPARLEVDPAVTLCLACASGSERK